MTLLNDYMCHILVSCIGDKFDISQRFGVIVKGPKLNYTWYGFAKATCNLLHVNTDIVF